MPYLTTGFVALFHMPDPNQLAIDVWLLFSASITTGRQSLCVGSPTPVYSTTTTIVKVQIEDWIRKRKNTETVSGNTTRLEAQQYRALKTHLFDCVCRA